MIEITSKEKLYTEHLREIGEIKLTMREIDVISCILHNRGEKKIGELLVISYRTVSTHVRNVMSKFACNSRDQIIDIVEKSGKLQYIKQYYRQLILQGNFIKHIQKIAALTNRSGISYRVEASNISGEEQNLLQYIKLYLNLANINLTDKPDANTKTLYIASNSLFKEKEDANNLVLLLDDKVKAEIFGEREYIDFAHSKNHYLTLLLLLKKLIAKPAIDKMIEEFKSEQSALENSFKGNDIVESNKQIRRKTSIKFFAAIFTLCAALALIIWFFTNNQGPTNRSEVISESKSQNWNLPPLIGHYTQRPILTESIWKKFNQKKLDKNNIAVLAGLHGLGGIGKTTLAKNAIHFPEKEYDFKGWFGSESKNLLQNDYLALGERHNLFAQGNISPKQKVALVKEWLERQKSALLVYDNADDMDILQDYLPNRGDIIITSRNHNIPGAIEIDVMSKEESINLLNNLFPQSVKQQENYTEDAAILVETLGYLPLAISQAGAYITENNITVRNYLSLYSTEKNKLMSDKTMPSMDNHQPAYISWGITIKKLKEQENGDKALELLNAMSCCYPEHIPKKLLAQFLYDNTDNKAMVELNKLLTLLRKYSMIKTTSDSISMHRLVHDWIAYELWENTLDLDRSSLSPIAPLYEKLCKALNAFMPKVTVEYREYWPIAKSLVPHINIVLKLKLQKNRNILIEEALLYNKLGLYYQFINYESPKALQYYQESQNIYNKLAIRNDDLAETLINQGRALNFMWKLDEALNSLDKALSILDNSGPNELRAVILTVKGLVYSKKGNTLNDAGRCYLESYKIYKKLYPDQDYQRLATAIHNIGWYEYKSNNLDLALKWFNDSLAMYRRLYKGEVHEDIAASLNLIGDLHRTLGGEENLYISLKYLLESLEIKETLAEGIITPYLISTYSNLEKTYEALGIYDKALDFVEKMLAGTYKLYNDYTHEDISESFLRLGEIQEKMGNLTEAKEYYKKSYILLWRNNCNMEHPRDKQLLDYLERLLPGFIENPEARIYITQRNMFSKERYDIKTKIQSEILDKLYDRANRGIWFNKKDGSWFDAKQAEENLGAENYISDANIRKTYGSKMTREELTIAKELCFEAINFGIMSKPEEQRDLKCFVEFIKLNSELVKHIATEYPEYFVDGSLLIEASRLGVILEEVAKKAISEEEYSLENGL